ncbi:MAG: DUF4291 domain-containing protein [Oscillospiraceae bacterium]|nr:DUF4291 domain-containing protein [Oscillospiraceae bacterium]
MKYIKEVFASYSKSTIRVYQAFCQEIAEEAVKLQKFGESYNFHRMTWVKPSFLWMMYRSNWATKKNQEYILALDIYQESFLKLLSQAVLTAPETCSGKDWEKAFSETAVYCQWDSDRSLNGNALQRGAIQIGMKGSAMEEFLEIGICKITDMTPQVRKWNILRKNNKLKAKDLPVEKLFPVQDRKIRKNLDMG